MQSSNLIIKNKVYADNRTSNTCCGLMLSWLNCWATGEARVGVAKKLFLPPEDPLPGVFQG